MLCLSFLLVLFLWILLLRARCDSSTTLQAGSCDERFCGYWITWAVAGQRILHWTHDSWKMHTVAKSILPWHQRILDYLLLIGTLQRGETILSSWMHPSGLKRGRCTPIFYLFLPIPWECLFGCFQLVLPSWLSSSMPSLKLKLSCGIAPTVVCKGMKCKWMS